MERDPFKAVSRDYDAFSQKRTRDQFLDPYEYQDPFSNVSSASSNVFDESDYVIESRTQKRKDRSPSPDKASSRKLLPHDTPDRPELLRALRNAKNYRKEISEEAARNLFTIKLNPFQRPTLVVDEFFKQNNDYLNIYLLDLDYCTPFDGPPILRIFGLTIEGFSSSLYVENFAPYFFIRLNSMLTIDKVNQETEIRAFVGWLNRMAHQRDLRPPKKAELQGKYVRGVYLERKRSIFGYEKDLSNFIRIETVQPRHVPLLRDILQGKTPKIRTATEAKRIAEAEEEEEDYEDDSDSGERAPEPEPENAANRYGVFEVFEADIQFVLNFLVDKNLKGCGWLRVARSKLVIPKILETTTQLEFRCTSDSLESLPDKNDVPPLRIVSVDIECAGKENRFPLPEEDPIICISAILYRLQDGAKPMVALGIGVGAIDGSDKDYIKIQFGGDQSVINEETGEWNAEAEINLILAFWKFIVDISDPDFFSGFNDDNFDKPYIIHRADALGIGPAVRRMSRVSDELCSFSKSTFSSRAFGTRTDLKMKCGGRVMWDVMRIVRREIKARSYSLNYHSLEILGKKKHEISHDRIGILKFIGLLIPAGPMWIANTATPQTRRKILDYNKHDAALSYEINAKKLFIWGYQELARATGVPIDKILNRS
jgi:DNA polymerase delta subunit 1